MKSNYQEENEFNENIINWYNFKENSKILLIGNNEVIKNNLIKRNLYVEIYEEIFKNNQEEKNKYYEYIIIYGIENKNINIENMEKYLKNEGTILVIGNNDYGIQNWNRYLDRKDYGIKKLEEKNDYKNNILNILDKTTLKNNNIFYVFPNYREAEIIINKKYKIQSNQLGKYNNKTNKKEIKIFDENKVLENIINYNPKMLEFFANSFIVELSNYDIDTKERYISFNNYRNEEYRLMTIITEERVEKRAVTSKAKRHINQMKRIVEETKKLGINNLDYVEDGRVYSKLIKNERTLDEVLADKYQNLEEIAIVLNEIKRKLEEKSIPYEECEKEIKIRKYEGIEKMKFLKNAFWDMVPKNCFYINGEYIFFDQEWVANYLPVEFIIYRSVINSYNLVKQINVDKLLERLNILQYKKVFEKIDNELRNQIVNEKYYREKYLIEEKTIENIINDNKRYLEIIENYQKENIKKEKYIIALETEDKRKAEYIRTLEEKRARFYFWRKRNEYK